MAYNLRGNPKPDFHAICDIRLPKATRVRHDPNKLYPVEILETDGERVKLHYVGYGSHYDEWRDATDVEEQEESETASASEGALRLERFRPLDLHRELRYQIKMACNSGTRHDPDVRIEMVFDPLLFTGGLQQLGKFVRRSRGHDVYTITKYSSLVPLLGERWHVRGLNSNDFCYVRLDTVLYYIHFRRELVDFDLSTSQPSTVQEPSNCLLVFRFVRIDATKQQWDSVLSIP